MPKDIDAELVRKLAGLLDETGLGELEYSIDNWKIRVVKPTSISMTASQNVATTSENSLSYSGPRITTVRNRRM